MKHRPANALFCRCGQLWGDGECVSSCAACHVPQPAHYRVWCAECGHTWRWKWLLSLHDAQARWKLGGWQFHGDLTSGPWWVRVRNSIPHVPSRIWVCPCCSHDL